MAQIMAQQEHSGFRFDMHAAERVRSELQHEMEQLQSVIKARFVYVPGKVFTPKRNDKRKNGYVCWCAYDKVWLNLTLQAARTLPGHCKTIAVHGLLK